jgi:hypothetical protein
MWLCRCKCGVEVVLRRTLVIQNRRKYCDLTNHADEVAVARSKAVDASRIYQSEDERLVASVWRAMRRRCDPALAYPNEKHHYADRGVTVCDRWVDFAAFYADMGPRPTPQHSIERLDTDGNYEPDNCVWATSKEQSRNKRTTRWVEWQGVARKLIEVCEEQGLPLNVVSSRLALGWLVERALTTPKGKRGRPHTDAQCPR